MKIKLELNEKQAGVILTALDVYSRLHSGQFEEILGLDIRDDKGKNKHVGEWALGEELRQDLQRLKLKMTGLGPSTYWGITQVADVAKTACDIKEVLRNAIAWFKNPKGGSTVLFDRPMHWNTKVPLCNVNIIEE